LDDVDVAVVIGMPEELHEGNAEPNASRLAEH